MKNKWWEIIGVITSVISAIVGIIALMNQVNETPHFKLSHSTFTSNEEICISPLNDIAKKELPLSIQWDGYIFSNALKFSKSADSSCHWKFIPKDIFVNKKSLKDKNLLTEDSHTIKFSFNDDIFSNELKVKVLEDPYFFPSKTLCENNGGEKDTIGCKATWDNANKICSAKNRILPILKFLNKEDLDKEKRIRSTRYWASDINGNAYNISFLNQTSIKSEFLRCKNNKGKYYVMCIKEEK